MMKAQTLEFNIGYAFAKIDKKLFDYIKGGCKGILIGEVSIPKIWFGLSCSTMSNVDISLSEKEEIGVRLYDIFENANPHFYLCINIRPDKQYITIDYVITRKEHPKKMTVNEIEKALGYKVEIVSE